MRNRKASATKLINSITNFWPGTVDDVGPLCPMSCGSLAGRQSAAPEGSAARVAAAIQTFVNAAPPPESELVEHDVLDPVAGADHVNFNEASSIESRHVCDYAG